MIYENWLNVIDHVIIQPIIISDETMSARIKIFEIYAPLPKQQRSIIGRVSQDLKHDPRI